MEPPFLQPSAVIWLVLIANSDTKRLFTLLFIITFLILHRFPNFLYEHIFQSFMQNLEHANSNLDTITETNVEFWKRFGFKTNHFPIWNMVPPIFTKNSAVSWLFLSLSWHIQSLLTCIFAIVVLIFHHFHNVSHGHKPHIALHHLTNFFSIELWRIVHTLDISKMFLLKNASFCYVEIGSTNFLQCSAVIWLLLLKFLVLTNRYIGRLTTHSSRCGSLSIRPLCSETYCDMLVSHSL